MTLKKFNSQVNTIFKFLKTKKKKKKILVLSFLGNNEIQRSLC